MGLTSRIEAGIRKFRKSTATLPVNLNCMVETGRAGITQYLRYSDGLEGWSSIPGRAKFLSSPQCPDWRCGPPSLLSSGYRG
jgi:hypothetical protein